MKTLGKWCSLLALAVALSACGNEPQPSGPGDTGGSGGAGGTGGTGGTGGIDQPVCGDGEREGDEACDDGAGNSDTAPDACRTDCTPAGCGDGVLDTGETCDDGNLVADDGCSPTCILEDCGNGAIDGDEECDDGNVVSGDGCSDACNDEGTPGCGDGILQAGEDCDDGNDIDTDACVACAEAACGDGFVEAGAEECDDGGTAPGDGCDATCQYEGFCGDGLRNPLTEECDDGNTADTDACLGDCTDAACGDGKVWAGEEACDEGAANSDTLPDACRTSCEAAGCGDAVIDGNEECEDGNADDTDACVACKDARCGDGFVRAGAEGCDQGPANSDTAADACRTTCTPARCGDGVADTGEGCDHGANNSDTVADACRISCTPARCGDGVHDTGEVCDQGANNSDTLADACRTTCTPADCGDGVIDTGESCDAGANNSNTLADACRTTCVPADCGDGVVDTGEACDSGTNNSDTAANACRTSCAAAGCGDGVIDTGETCDDGAANSDSAANACRTSCAAASCGDGVIDTGETCDAGTANSNTAANACRTACVPASCGDGVVDTGESCDNGTSNSNTVANACRTTCVAAACGDSVIDAGETCDDGNTTAGDGCDATCIVENPCGNGVVNAGEVCDDGARVAGDGCSETCQAESGYSCVNNVCVTVCGDGLVRGTEVCDDGNPSPADGCTADCRIAGDTCAEAVSLNVVDADPDANIWSWTSTTAGRAGDYNGDNLPQTCPATGGKPDVVASFTVPVDGLYFFEQTMPTYWDSVLYATLTCGGVDGIGCGDTPSFTPAVLTAGTTVYVVVDGYGSTVGTTPSGAFTLTVKRRYCGDGHKLTTEACDNGANNSDTAPNACRTDCTLARCGDGVTDTGETCDDGNASGGDGCSRTCILEGGCGDEIRQAGEACEDGNLIAGDGCSTTCAVESGWQCPAGVGACATVCGDGTVVGTEGCEDGNAVDWDGCTNCGVDGDSCRTPMPLARVDTNANPDIWVWTGSTVSMARDFNSQPACAQSGGKRDAVAVLTAPGAGRYNIDMDVTWDGVVFAYKGSCGTGTVVGCADAENIDVTLAAEETIWIVLDGYGNTVSESNAGAFTLTVTRHYCGDGVRDTGEACDAGPANSDTAPDACRTNCAAASCGDGTIDGPESCDDGNTTAGDGCSATCHAETGCGNGVVEGAEVCDDGNSRTADGCAPVTCAAETGWTCPANACVPICGDGLTLGNEACDDDNTTSWDGCTSCLVDGDSCLAAVPLDTVDSNSDPRVWAWSGSTASLRRDFAATCANSQGHRDAVTAFTAPAAAIYTVEVFTPFDAVLFARSVCDGATELGCTDGPAGNAIEAFDLNLANNETVYLFVDGYGSTVDETQNGPFGLTVTQRYCGDGLIHGTEACDGGPSNSDTTPNACRYDCTLPACGDGVVDRGERCDDGNLVDGDACAANCQTSGSCGNATLDTGEGCDDANTVVGDGCALGCTVEAGWTCVANTCLPTCGDGLTVGPEGCDDGNTTDGDGCSSTCQCAPAQTQTVAATIATPIAIPNPTPVDSPITSSVIVSGAVGVITDLDVYVEIPHTNTADLDLFLVGPNGLRIPLVQDRFSTYDNVYDGTTFDDDANPTSYAVRVTSATTSANGVKAALQPEVSLGVFHGLSPNGTWTLEVFDDASSGAGTLDAFSITFKTNVGVVPGSTRVFSSTAIQPIADNNGSSPLLSTIVVPNGIYGDIFEARVRVNIVHASADQLDVSLVAPDGVVYELTTDNGGSNDDVFAGTLFLESATAPLATGGTYSNFVVRPETVPESSLSKLVGATMPGTWTLKVADDASGVTGVLKGWSLEVVPVSCDLPR